MEKINFEDGQLTKKGYVVIDGKEYLINEAQYDGATPLSAYVLNKMQDNIEEGINNIQALPTGGTKGQVLTKQSETEGDANWEDIEANEVFVGNEEEAPETAKIIIEDEDFEEGSTLGKAEVYVGAEEPTTGEKVWFRIRKNLLNYNKLTDKAKNVGIKIDNNDNVYSSATSDSREWNYNNSNWYITLLPGTYTISLLYSKQTSSTNGGIGIYSKDKEIVFKGTQNINNYNYTFTLTEKTQIGIMMKIYDGIFKIQLESGTVATTPESYIEPQIYVRNSNGVYEEFAKKSEEVYSTEEQRIGTWIDGKPLYRIIKECDVSAKETQSNDISSIPYDTIFINLGKSFNRWVDNSSASIVWNTSDNDNGNVWINYEKKLNILNSSNAARHYWITLEYTKTTD